jgi:hypothetical protein
LAGQPVLQQRAALQQETWIPGPVQRLLENRRDSGGVMWPGASAAPLSGLDRLRDPAGIEDAFRRINLLLGDDPAGVVGAVKELIEATAKTVLNEMAQSIPPNADLPALVGAAQKALGLTPSGTGSVDSSEPVKKVLGGLKGIAIGLGELRNAEGSGHGRAKASGLEARHARLALNAGRTWCEIVLDTFIDPRAPWRKR